jgi:hypothetical protein
MREEGAHCLPDENAAKMSIRNYQYLPVVVVMVTVVVVVVVVVVVIVAVVVVV